MIPRTSDTLCPEVKQMERSFPEYLCLSDLLDQDLTAYEYFQTLSPQMQQRLRREDGGSVTNFDGLQARVRALEAQTIG